MKRIMMILSCIFLSLSGSALEWPFLSDLMSFEEIQKLEKSGEKEKAAREYWKRIREKGDEKSFEALQQIPKEALSESLRKEFIFDAAEALAEKRGMEEVPYTGNAFVVVQDKNALIEKIYAYCFGTVWTRWFISWKGVLLGCVQSAFPTHIYTGPSGRTYRLRSFQAEGNSIPFLTTEILQREFPDTEFDISDKLGLYFIDKVNPRKLVLGSIYKRILYRQKIDAFVALCQHYGAKEMTLTRMAKSNKEIIINGKADVPVITGVSDQIISDGRVSADANGSMDLSYSELFYCQYHWNGIRAAGNPPESPWLHKEFDSFRRQCESANRIQKMQVTFEFSENLGFSADFIGELEKYGLDANVSVGATGKIAETFRCTYTIQF